MPKKTKSVLPVAHEIPEEKIELFHQQLGKRIRKVRKEKRFRLDHFAYEVGISRGTMIKIEQGNRLTSTNLLKIIYGLGLEIDEFFQEGFDFLQPEPKTRP